MTSHTQTSPVLQNVTQDITLNVSDSQHSLVFYRDLLGFALIEQQAIEGQPGAVALLMDIGNGNRLRIQNYPMPLQPSPWMRDDLQPGFRHLGFQVQSTDATTARLKAANVPFTLDPLDATGGVRIAFFKDPDGILLEVLEGTLQYHVVGNGVAPTRPDLPRASGPGELVYDHIAISVSDLHQELHFYQEGLGFPMLGQLIFNDARGFTITYLQAGLGVLELFSFSKPMLPRPAPIDAPTVGIQRIGFVVEELAALEAQIQSAGPLGADLSEAPAGKEEAERRILLTDPEGNLLAFTQRDAS